MESAHLEEEEEGVEEAELGSPNRTVRGRPSRGAERPKFVEHKINTLKSIILVYGVINNSSKHLNSSNDYSNEHP